MSDLETLFGYYRNLLASEEYADPDSAITFWVKSLSDLAAAADADALPTGVVLSMNELRDLSLADLRGMSRTDYLQAIETILMDARS